MGPGDEVVFKEDGKWLRGVIREVAPEIPGYPRKFVVRVPGVNGTSRSPLVEVLKCRPTGGSRKFNEGDRVRVGQHAGTVDGILLILPNGFEARVQFDPPYPKDYGSTGWVPFGKLEHETAEANGFAVGETVGSRWSTAAPGVITTKGDDGKWRVRWPNGREHDYAEADLILMPKANPSETPNTSPTPAQREALLLAAAEMHAEESRPKEPRCEAWKAEVVLGAADWESEIPSRGVTFHTTHEGHVEVDATDADEAVGTVTFARPHCREAVVVMLNARLKAKRLDDAAGIVTPEEVAQP